MSTIEFVAQVKNGMIRIPDQYQGLENMQLKIIIQPHDMKSSSDRKQAIKHLLSEIIARDIFKRIASPEEWQRNLRDEWQKGLA